MAGHEQELDANEPATPFKLDKAHERGSIVRSAEVNFAVVLLICVACVFGLGAHALAQLAAMVGHAMSLASRPGLAPLSALAVVGDSATRAGLAVAPIVFVVWTGATLTAALQARGVLSGQPLVPDFDRINPAAGLKKLFSIRSLNELWRSLAKIVVIAVAMKLWGDLHLDAITRLSRQGPRTIALASLDMIGSALVMLAAIVAIFALIDWTLNRRDYLKRMRMSRRELKDEHKEREGDPRIKTRLRELRIEWLKRSRQLARVKDADVLLTNPTHYAVALEYRHGEMPAPMITARGAGDLALRMRVEARRCNVPVVENAPLARALFALDDAQVLVPQEHFEPVARVLRWVYAARGATRGTTASRRTRS